MRSMVLWASLAAGAAALVPAADAGAQPPSMSISGVTAIGSGCPGGGARVSYLPGQEALIVRVPGSLSVETGPGIDPARSNASCTLIMDVDVTPGYRFGIRSASYRGYADLGPGVIGRHSISTWFQGGLIDRETFTTTLTGPHAASYSRSDVAAPSAWSSCGQGSSLYINMNAAVSEAFSPDHRGNLRADGSYQLGVAWRPC